MNRREFVSFLALLAAGAAAKPEQVAAFERYYDLNSPAAKDGLVAVDDIYVAGMFNRALPLKLDLYKENETALCLGLNAFGGVLRWVAGPDQKIITRANDFRWKFTSPGGGDLGEFENICTGHISYIDQDGFRITRPFIKSSGSLIL